MDRLCPGHSSLRHGSMRLVLDGKMTVSLTVRNADKAHGLSTQDSHFLLTVGSLDTYCARVRF